MAFCTNFAGFSGNTLDFAMVVEFIMGRNQKGCIHVEKNLTNGSVLKTVVSFSLPYLLSYLLQTLYGMADLFIIGQYEGVASTTAVSIGSQVMHMLTVMLVGLAMGTTVSIAQAVGAGKPERAIRTLQWAIALCCGFNVLVVAAVQFAAEPLVALFTPDAAVAISGGQYLRGYVWDSSFAGVQFSFSGFFCACGKSELSFLHNFLSILLVRIPGAYLASRLFPQTLLPMGLSNAAGSLFSILVCVIAFAVLRRRAARERSLHG